MSVDVDRDDDYDSMEASVFHAVKRPPAVLKHALLDKYLSPFVGKVGSTSIAGRVAFVDGFAGPGRYADLQEGSGALALRKANELAHIGGGRALECHFVEQDPATAARLASVVTEEARGATATVRSGCLADALPEVLDAVEGLPCLFYLDPCGLLPPFSTLEAILERRARGGAATELLVNFSAVSLRRIGGHLTSDAAIPATLDRMDHVCGGDWWRQTWLDHLPDTGASEEAVVEAYMSKIAGAMHGAAWSIDVKQKVQHKPKYYLVFGTRHKDGFTAFGETASKALEEWRRCLAELEARGTLLEDGGWELEFDRSETALRAVWEDAIFANIRTLAASGLDFTVLAHYNEVFGEFVGVARSMHLRAAWKRAFDAGLVANTPRGVKDLLGTPLVPA